MLVLFPFTPRSVAADPRYVRTQPVGCAAPIPRLRAASDPGATRGWTINARGLCHDDRLTAKYRQRWVITTAMLGRYSIRHAIRHACDCRFLLLLVYGTYAHAPFLPPPKQTKEKTLTQNMRHKINTERPSRDPGPYTPPRCTRQTPRCARRGRFATSWAGLAPRPSLLLNSLSTCALSRGPASLRDCRLRRLRRLSKRRPKGAGLSISALRPLEAPRTASCPCRL